MCAISFNVFAKQTVYWAEHGGNVMGASLRLPPSLSVWVTQLQSFLQMDVWPDHRGHAEHKLSALAAGDANALGRAQRSVKQKSAVRGDLWDNGAAFRK